MNMIPNIDVAVDINSLAPVFIDHILNVNDTNSRTFSVSLYANNEKISLYSGNFTAKAAISVNNILLDDDVTALIQTDSTVAVTVDNKYLTLIPGVMKIQLTITGGTGGTDVIVTPLPILARVTSDLAQTAQILPDSHSSYSEIVAEIVAARGDFDSLSEAIESKVSFVETTDPDIATDNGVWYKVRTNTENFALFATSTTAQQAQFRITSTGTIGIRRRYLSSGGTFPAWGAFDRVGWKQSEIDDMIATYLANVKAQTITAQSTHNQIPTAKAVYDWTGNYINALTDRETALDGIVSQEWEIGMRYLVNGVETWSGTSTSRMSTKPGTYIRFNKDDLIVMKKTMDYQFLVVYSTDNGSTWTSTLNRILPYSILEDSIGWICIGKKSGTFTEEEMQSVVNNYFFILRKGTGEIKKNALLAEALSIASGSFDRSEIIDSKYGFTYQDAKTTDTVVLSYDLLLPEFEASKGDIFAIKVSISIDYPDMYSNIGVRIYERYNGNTVKTTDITDISDTIIYTVSNSNADAIHIRGLLLADEGDITTRHYEIFDYKISVVKKLPGEIEELLTEAGDIWEV